jgi:hypothetical protein
LKRVVEEKVALRIVVCSNEWKKSILSISVVAEMLEKIFESRNF